MDFGWICATFTGTLLRSHSLSSITDNSFVSSHLVELDLNNIPKTGYISPEAMAGGLAALTSLQTLFIIFLSKKSCPDRSRLPPATRSVLPTLISFEFQGVNEYLEDLVARIDCPRIKWIKIWYLNRRVGFRVAQLFGFIDRLEDPRPRQFESLDVGFATNGNICLEASHTRRGVVLCMSFLGVEWGVSHIVQVFGQFSAQLSDVRHLSIAYYRRGPEILGHNELVQFLHPFTAVQTLHVSKGRIGHDPPALEDVTRETVLEAEVLPVLGLIYLECSQGAFLAFFENIVAVRRLSGRPVTVAGCQWKFDDKLKPYLSEQDLDPHRFDWIYEHVT